MKSVVDAAGQNHQFPLSKQQTPISTASATTYEPTSVLDLRSSPAVATLLSDDPSSFLPVEDWDSMLWPQDDSAPALTNIPQFAPPQTLNPSSFDSSPPPLFLLSDFNPIPPSSDFNYHPPLLPPPPPTTGRSESPSFDRLQLDQLLRAADCVEWNDLSLAHVILARLNQQLLSPVGKPLQRAAFYFKEALESLLLLRPSKTAAVSPLDTVQKIVAYKAFSELSPVFQFANFTANQAILEAVDGLGFIHVIDFDIGLGGQWPSFMQEIAMKSARVPPPSLRITAIVVEESMETKLTGDILCSFARELGIRFQIEFVELAGFKSMALASIRFAEGEAVVVNLSPWIFREIDGTDVTGFLRILRRISPRIAVFVDTECRKDAEAGVPSFRRNFIDGLEFYSVLLESLDAAAAIGGAADQMRRIERFLIRPRIFRSVEAAGSRMAQWKELLSGSGMAPVALSETTESQAQCLLRRVPLREFHVVKRHPWMMLCWQGRELVATSAWRCC